MKILHIQWGICGTADIDEAFIAEGHEVVGFPFSKNQDAVYSFNFFPVISKVCAREDIRYIAWVFDDPCVFLYSETIVNTCNCIYIFDKELCARFQKEGISTVHYMPLAANTERLDAMDKMLDTDIHTMFLLLDLFIWNSMTFLIGCMMLCQRMQRDISVRSWQSSCRSRDMI